MSFLEKAFDFITQYYLSYVAFTFLLFVIVFIIFLLEVPFVIITGSVEDSFHDMFGGWDDILHIFSKTLWKEINQAETV